MIKHKEQRVGVLVDVSNMYHSAKNLFKRRTNFKEILKEAVAGRKLIRATAYVIKTESEEGSAFFEALGQQGFEVKMKDLQIFAGGAKKADWDVGLAVDAVKLATKVDTIVIASGDGDFVPLVEYLKVSCGNQVEVVAFGKSTSGKLKEIADEFTDLGENPKRYLLHPRRGRVVNKVANGI